MKRRMVFAIVIAIVTVISLLVFIALYINAMNTIQETYYRQYITEMGHLSRDAGAYLDAEGDHELRYRMIISDASCADDYLFLLNGHEKEQIIINEVKTCLIKYPEQMSGKMKELKTASDDIIAGLDKGYDEADALVKSINKKGH
ncbi:hypothetical protein SAMN02910447_01550 [Ruminococcus sp. YE71]|uniref:hypothetical protein n=1 Tax=unclassified Ruminococcus TaxID=2608920 RepID=UPI000908D52C|nr:MULTISPECIES: hypothetical protein [unclassified Ruminococcus]SFW30048.1 hypothetical protein SAMN02910447_01550 [Ruminococcus sp. YE71]